MSLIASVANSVGGPLSRSTKPSRRTPRKHARLDGEKSTQVLE